MSDKAQTAVAGSRIVYDLSCPKCGCDKPKVWVHGHYQCADCKCVADGDCCQGEVSVASGGDTDG